MIFLLTMIPVIIGLMQLPFAQATCYVPPSNECARLYEHTRCEGAHLKAYPGTYNKWVGSSFNDKATAVVVRAGCELTIYQDANGGGHSKSLGDARHSYWYDLGRQSIVLGSTAFGNWNDWVSSFKCACLDCPAPWFRLGNQCFLLRDEKSEQRNWPSARTYCGDQASGADLAQPNDLKALDDYRKDNGHSGSWYFLGGSDLAKEGDWRWNKGNGAITRWAKSGDNPDGRPGDDCLVMWSGWGANSLADYQCGATGSFICERH